jgi:hypothetical protein
MIIYQLSWIGLMGIFCSIQFYVEWICFHLPIKSLKISTHRIHPFYGVIRLTSLHSSHWWAGSFLRSSCFRTTSTWAKFGCSFPGTLFNRQVQSVNHPGHINTTDKFHVLKIIQISLTQEQRQRGIICSLILEHVMNNKSIKPKCKL